MSKRLKGFEVTILKGGVQIFKGLFEDFVEGFVYNEDDFYKQVSKKSITNFPNIPVNWIDDNSEIELQFQI